MIYASSTKGRAADISGIREQSIISGSKIVSGGGLGASQQPDQPYAALDDPSDPGALSRVRAQLLQDDERKRMDPRFMLVRFILVNTREDLMTHVQVQSQRHMYNMFLDKNATILDLR